MVAKEKQSVQAKFDAFLQTVFSELERKKRKLTYTNGQWHEYHNGVWIPWTAMQREAFNATLYRLASLVEFSFSTQRPAIWTTLEAALGNEDAVPFDHQPMIVAPNGTYFLVSDELKKHSPLHYATRAVDVPVDLDAECPLWLAALDRMFEDYDDKSRVDTITCLQEWMGVAVVGGAQLRGNRDLRKGLFAVGDTRTGKSSVSDVVKRLLGGDRRIASPSIAELSSRFGLEPLIGKTAIISSEAASTRTDADSNRLKNLISGEPLQADRKGSIPVEFIWDGPVLFTTNDLPKVHETTNALYNRLLVIEFTRQFQPEDVKATLGGYSNLISQMEGEKQLSGILNWCLEGYDRAIERGRLFVPASAENAAEKFRRQNDRVFDFLKSCVVYDKSSACCSRGLAIACVEFSMMQHDHKMSVATAVNSLARATRGAVVGAKLTQGYHEKSQFRSWSHLRLTERGLAALEVAKTKPQYTDIKDVMRRVNYKIG